ncbi:MAG: hypothetical protein KME16_22075 [Scytolyngbya sp. HA4215-MV1]|jgi:hypothetical protein|nr:hypothetical protein [Scytolyngbya sp. HA4215-MV1]
MAKATKKVIKATIVKPATIEHTKTALQALPEKPKEGLSLREAVNRLQEPLRAALNKGYNYEDLAKMLTERGIKISTATLKNYVPSGKRSGAQAKPLSVKPTDNSSKRDAVTQGNETNGSYPKPEEMGVETSTKPRRGRATSSTSAQPQPATSPSPGTEKAKAASPASKRRKK